MFDHIMEYYIFLYCNMQAGPRRVDVLIKMDALDCWEDAE